MCTVGTKGQHSVALEDQGYVHIRPEVKRSGLKEKPGVLANTRTIRSPKISERR